MPTVRPGPTEGRACPAGQGPEDFEWTEQCTPDDDGMPGHAGCCCAAGTCERGTCPCASSCLAPNERGRLIAMSPREPAELELTACGPACACFGACACSFDSAAAAALEIVTLCEQPGKGWCAYADEPLPTGLIVCQVRSTQAPAMHRSPARLPACMPAWLLALCASPAFCV